MADDVSSSPSSPSSTGSKGGKFGFLTRKVGPLPLGVWLAAAVLIFLYMQHRNKAGGGQQTDPAGNVGTIDPQTGYVYGSPEDKAALGSSGGGGGGGDNTSGGGGDTTAGKYATNAEWERAAINYLVARGVDPTAANEAITSWLSSQQLTPEQQADVNLAIQGLGTGPPDPPGPVGTPPPPVVTPPQGVVYATNPPTGVTVSGATSTTLTVKWNRATNATGYTVRFGRTSAASDGSVSAGAEAGQATIGGLTPKTTYYVHVQATPAKPADPYGSASGTTTAASTPGPMPGPVPPTPPGPVPPGPKLPAPTPAPAPSGKRSYTVVHGDTLSGIAGKLHVSGGWQALYSENKATIEAAAKAHGKSSSDNGHWIFPGTVLHY